MSAVDPATLPDLSHPAIQAAAKRYSSARDAGDELAEQVALDELRARWAEFSTPSHAVGTTKDALAVTPLDIEPASAWSDRDPPPPRDEVIGGLAIYAGRTALFTGNGGFGKTNIALSMLISCAVNRALYGHEVRGGIALGLFCEDEQAEIERRVRDQAAAEDIPLSSLDRLHVRSLDAEDNVLCTFHRDQIVLTDRWRQIDATFARLRPRLAVLDTVADLFAGDFMSTPHVRQFVKVCIGSLAARYGTAIVLLAHPSAAAMKGGDGSGFSVAWNNSVRSRIYLRHPKSEDMEAIADRRVLQVMKSNYGPAGATIPLIYDRGRFCLDLNPINEGGSTRKEPRVKHDTRLAIAVAEYFREKASSGAVVSFGAIFEALQAAGEIPHGNYETVRKPLQRTLKALADDGVIKASEVPRGYRFITSRGV